VRISFIGGGVMAEAIVQGILRKGLATPGDLVVSDVAPARREILSKRYDIITVHSNAQAVEPAEVVILSIKPQNLTEVFGGLAGNLSDRLLLSIVAGASIGTLMEGFRHERIVRVMPNTPAQIGQGISVWTATESVSEDQREAAQQILMALGREIFVSDEKYLDMATAVSGSGPAYIFLILEALIDAAVHIGLGRQLAEELVLQTAVGSALFARKSGKHLAELRNMVTSPAGTTAAALLKLEQAGLRASLIEAVTAAYERATVLGRTDNK